MLKYIIIGLALIGNCFASAPRHNALIVAEYDTEDRGTGDYVNLVRYHFTDGMLTSKDTILDVTSRIISYDLNNSLLYKDRYVITPVGYIIDIQTKLMLKRERSSLYETRGDSLIFYKFFSPEYTEYYIYDLNKKYYEKVKDYGLLNLRGILSPNHRWGLKQTIFPSPRKIILYDSTYKQDTIISDCGIGTPMSKYSSIIAEVPCCWIDNDNFLYAYFQSNDPISESSKYSATIHKVNIKSKSSEIIQIIDSIPQALSAAKLFSTLDGNIIFSCSKGDIKIDITSKQSSLGTIVSVGNEFSCEYDLNPEYGRVIKFDNKEIGRLWCNNQAKTTDGFYSVAYGDLGSNLGYPKGVMVWNNITEKWTEIEINWLSSIVGWIEE